jgi:hypothetical protein
MSAVYTSSGTYISTANTKTNSTSGKYYYFSNMLLCMHSYTRIAGNGSIRYCITTDRVNDIISDSCTDLLLLALLLLVPVFLLVLTPAFCLTQLAVISLHWPSTASRSASAITLCNSKTPAVVSKLLVRVVHVTCARVSTSFAYPCMHSYNYTDCLIVNYIIKLLMCLVPTQRTAKGPDKV